MRDDCYGTCPKCGEIGWCHYKGKARIFKSGPGSDTYKVSLFKCKNCGKKFGFELEDRVPELKLNKEEDDSDWEEMLRLLYDTLHYYGVNANIDINRALTIAAKHCRCDS